MNSDYTEDIKLLSPEGYSNTSSIATIGGVTLDPKLISIEPSVGSIGGSVITVTGSGFGTSSIGLLLFDVTTETSLCVTHEIISYGVFTCVT